VNQWVPRFVLPKRVKVADERTEYLASGTGPEPVDRERMDSIRAVLADEHTWAEPPPEVADHVVAAIGAQAEEGTALRRRWSWTAVGIAAAAVVALVLGLSGVFSSEETTFVSMAGTDLQPEVTGQAAIKKTGSGWWIELDLDDLPAAAPGTYYEAWVWNDEGEGVSIGTFHFRETADPIVMWSGVDPADYPSVWVTLEDEDGNPSASDRIVVWGRADDA
jgi:anti-sigma-K factor RskA